MFLFKVKLINTKMTDLFNLIPTELICEICKHLKPKEILEFALTSKTYYNILESNKNKWFRLEFIYYHLDCNNLNDFYCFDEFYQIKFNDKKIKLKLISLFLAKRLEIVYYYIELRRHTLTYQEKVKLINDKIICITYSTGNEMLFLFDKEKKRYYCDCIDYFKFHTFISDLKDEIRKKTKLNLIERNYEV